MRDYQKRHEEWLSLQQKLLLEQATPEMKLESRLEYEEQKIRESTDGRGGSWWRGCASRRKNYKTTNHELIFCGMEDVLEQK